ncbi:protein kinase [Kitasatospora indigofera]|uniref:serine/threonine-protein kinase n=1 Tax=Kitasatospora indigofera TaxID=67307 RepID=UPI0036A6B990
MSDGGPTTADLGLESVVTREQLASRLRMLHARADSPSLRILEQRTRMTATRLRRTTVSDMLAARRFPKREVLLAFVRECGVPEGDLGVWRQAWERLSVPEQKQSAGPRPGADLREVSSDPEAATLRAEVDRLRRELALATAQSFPADASELRSAIAGLREELRLLRAEVAGSVPAESSDRDAKRVGGYLLGPLLGSGGMAQVFMAFTPSGRRLAMKMVHPELASGTDFRRRFAREVEAARRVSGFYTAPVVDADPYAQVPWVATAYVPGPALGAAVGELGPLPQLSLWRLIAGVSEALEAIHSVGVLHRDLKPSNVLLAEDGPRVIDFGVARMDPKGKSSTLTRTGFAVGTPAFMAPEQLRGQVVTEAADIFSLGGLAVFAATGHGPFGDAPIESLLYQIVHEEPDLSRCPAHLRALVSDCLAKDPADRPSLAEITNLAATEVAKFPSGLTAPWWPFGGTTDRFGEPASGASVRPAVRTMNLLSRKPRWVTEQVAVVLSEASLGEDES